MGYAPMGMEKVARFMEGRRLFCIELDRSRYLRVTFAAKRRAHGNRRGSRASDGRGETRPENFDPVSERDELRTDRALSASDALLLPTITSRIPILQPCWEISRTRCRRLINTANRDLAATV